MQKEWISKWGRDLYGAAKSGVPISVLSEEVPQCTKEDAYAVQKAMVQVYLSEGAILSGRKVGMTSKAMQEQFQIDEPDYGYLFRHLQFDSGRTIEEGRLIDPMIEAEVAFVLKNDLADGEVTRDQVVSSIDYALASLEIIDARTRHFDTTIEDSIADNASFGAYVLGDLPVKPEEVDFSFVGMIMEKNHKQIGTSCGASVMGDPVNAVVWLANKMAQLGDPLKKGEVVLSGSFMAAVKAEKGDFFRARFGHLGEVSVFFE